MIPVHRETILAIAELRLMSNRYANWSATFSSALCTCAIGAIARDDAFCAAAIYGADLKPQVARKLGYEPLGVLGHHINVLEGYEYPEKSPRVRKVRR